MKVICIDDAWEHMEGYEETADILFGQIVTIRDYQKDEDGEFYSFYEYDEDALYEISAFAPLSDIDETELVKEREELIYQ